MDGSDRTGLQPAAPVRTCIGCRGRDSRSALLRVVLETEARGASTPVVLLRPDPESRRPGRGAWLHPDLDCLELAIRRRAFGRALRSSSPLDPAPVTAYLQNLLQDVPSPRTESGFIADEHPMSTQQ